MKEREKKNVDSGFTNNSLSFFRRPRESGKTSWEIFQSNFRVLQFNYGNYTERHSHENFFVDRRITGDQKPDFGGSIKDAIFYSILSFEFRISSAVYMVLSYRESENTSDLIGRYVSDVFLRRYRTENLPTSRFDCEIRGTDEVLAYRQLESGTRMNLHRFAGSTPRLCFPAGPMVPMGGLAPISPKIAFCI